MKTCPCVYSASRCQVQSQRYMEGRSQLRGLSKAYLHKINIGHYNQHDIRRNNKLRSTSQFSVASKTQLPQLVTVVLCSLSDLRNHWRTAVPNLRKYTSYFSEDFQISLKMRWLRKNNSAIRTSSHCGGKTRPIT